MAKGWRILLPLVLKWLRSEWLIICLENVEQDAATAARPALVLGSIWSKIWALWNRAQGWGFGSREREWNNDFQKEKETVYGVGVCREREGGREGETALLYQLCPQIQIPNVLIPKRIRELKPNPVVFAQICLKRTEILFLRMWKSSWEEQKADYAEAGTMVLGDTIALSQSQMLTLPPNQWIKIEIWKYYLTNVI